MGVYRLTPTNNDDAVIVPAMSFARTTPPFTNWSPHSIQIWNTSFPTAEHAFQYKKHEGHHPELAEQIRLSISPNEAKRLAWSIEINQGLWDSRRQEIMLEIIQAKLSQHRSVQKALKHSGDKIIVQESTDNDMFWSIGKNGNGRNTMGKLWMIVREMYAS